MKFSIIVATNNSSLIGRYSNDKYYIPWKCSLDMKFFKDTTTNCVDGKQNAVIMGRNTYFSLPKINNTRKLKNRVNIVITSNPELIDDNDVITFTSLNNALNYCSNNNSIDTTFVIGGTKLYEEALYNQNLETIYWNIIKVPYDNDDDSSELSSKDSFDDNDINIYFPISLELALCRYEEDKTYDLNKYENTDVEFHKLYVRYENKDEQSYLDLLKKIMENGDTRQTRNSVTKSLFSEKLEFDLKYKFPLLTTKKMFLRGIFEELVWFLKGQTNSKILEEKKVNIC